MRFFLIDKIVSITCGREISAVKHIALSEDYFLEHFPGNPIMPGALMIEAMSQAGSALLEISRKQRVKALPIMVDQVKYRDLVRPGIELAIVMKVESDKDRIVRMDGSITCKGKTVVTGLITFILKAAEEIYPPMARSSIASLYEHLLRDAEQIGFPPEQDHD